MTCFMQGVALVLNPKQRLPTTDTLHLRVKRERGHILEHWQGHQELQGGAKVWECIQPLRIRTRGFAPPLPLAQAQLKSGQQ